MTAEPFSLWLPAPHSKKNKTKIIRYGQGRIGIAPSAEVEEETLQIRDLVERAIAAGPHAMEPGSLFPTEDVSVTMTVNARTNRLHLAVEHLRPRPKSFTGRRRDLHGHIETTMDAIEGLVLSNDNQVAELYIRRILEDDEQW